MARFLNATGGGYDRSKIMKAAYAIKALGYGLSYGMKTVWRRAREERSAWQSSRAFVRLAAEKAAAAPPVSESFRRYVEAARFDAQFIDDPFAYQAEMNRIARMTPREGL